MRGSLTCIPDTLGLFPLHWSICGPLTEGKRRAGGWRGRLLGVYPTPCCPAPSSQAQRECWLSSCRLRPGLTCRKLPGFLPYGAPGTFPFTAHLPQPRSLLLSTEALSTWRKGACQVWGFSLTPPRGLLKAGAFAVPPSGPEAELGFLTGTPGRSPDGRTQNRPTRLAQRRPAGLWAGTEAHTELSANWCGHRAGEGV